MTHQSEPASVAGSAPSEPALKVPLTAGLPTYSDALTALDGCTVALSRLMRAVRGLFENAGTPDGYAAAVDDLRAAHDAAVDWCAAEVKRHA